MRQILFILIVLHYYLSAYASIQEDSCSSEYAINWITFDEAMDYSQDTFKYYKTFSNTTFSSNAFFNDAIFVSKVDFEYTHFKCRAYFPWTKFKDFTNFYWAGFDKAAIFHFTEFDSISFIQTHFYSYAEFNQAKFKNYADFRGARFFSYATFDKAMIECDLDFRAVKFGENGILDLSNVQFENSKVINIMLTDVDISKIKMRYNNFRLAFDSSDDINSREAVYLDLLNRLIQLNYIEDAIKLDKEYQEWKYLEKDPNNKHWLVNAFQKYWWGYTYDKYLILYNTFYIYFFFFLINMMLIYPICYEIYSIDIIEKRLFEIKSLPFIKRNIKKITPTLLYTGLIFFGVYFNTVNMNKKSLFKGWRFLKIEWKILGVIYFFVMYLSGFFCLGYLVNFVLSK